MSDLQLLFLILAVIYCWECACWVRRGGVAFRTWFGRRWRAVHPGTLLGNQQGGFLFAHPLPPLGTLLMGNQFPLSISPEGVLAWVAPSINPGWRPAQSGRFVRFSEIRSVEARGRKLCINGAPFLKASSPSFAAELAQRLRLWTKAAPAERERNLQQLLENSLDTKDLERRWQEFQQRAFPVKLLANGLFGCLFVVAPVAIWKFGLALSWIWLLAGVLAFTVTTAVLFRRVHKRFYLHDEEERFTHFIIVLLSPATTIRAYDVLSRPLLESWHPLALAKVFCPEREFREFARRVLLEVRHPGLPLCPNELPAAQAAEQHSRAVLRQALEGLLKRNGIEPEELARPPAPADETCRAFCPRCRAQFTTSAGICEDCGGLALVPFSAPAAPMPCKTR